MNLSKMSLQQLREYVDGTDILTDEFLELLVNDGRAGVRQLYLKIMRQKVLKQKELARLQALEVYEQDLRGRGFRLIAGVDEVGRGPLAGPVVAAAVVLPPGIRLIGLDDSKKLTPAVRERLHEEILTGAVAFSVSVVSEGDIDRINIYQASLKAMQEAVIKLLPAPDYVLVDAVQIPGICAPQLSLVKGDGLSASIAAASVLAKVTRDRLMDSYDREYPQYGFARHKGYGTMEHIEAICKYGPCPIHRVSFNLKSGPGQGT
jgi:ribonuclease HII